MKTMISAIESGKKRDIQGCNTCNGLQYGCIDLEAMSTSLDNSQMYLYNTVYATLFP